MRSKRADSFTKLSDDDKPPTAAATTRTRSSVTYGASSRNQQTNAESPASNQHLSNSVTFGGVFDAAPDLFCCDTKSLSAEQRPRGTSITRHSTKIPVPSVTDNRRLSSSTTFGVTKISNPRKKNEDGSFPASPARTIASSSAGNEYGDDYYDEESPTSPKKVARRQCNPTKRWALVAWLVAAALAIAIAISLIAAFVGRPQNSDTLSDSGAEVMKDHKADEYGNIDAEDPPVMQNPTEDSEDVSDIFITPPEESQEEEVVQVTAAPSKEPTNRPTQGPTKRPTQEPTNGPTDTKTKAPTGTPTRAPTEGVTKQETASTTTTPRTASDFTIGVYYYPWHGKNFHNRQYLRGELEPPQLPALGEYDDTQPEVIGQHLEWSRGANINLWVSSWWGIGSREDHTLKDVIMKHPNLPGTKIALFYETTSRIKKSLNYATANVYSDVEYMARTYFDDPNYLHIDNRPVLFVYLSRVLSRVGILEEVTTLMRNAAFENGGHVLYIMGDQVFGVAPEDGNSYEPFDLLDGVTNYDVYGNMKRPNGYAGIERVNELHSRNKQWRDASRNHGNCDFVPAVAPGYNDRAVRDGNPALSRKLTEDSPEGSLFRTSLESALTLVEESTERMLMITSWNEWHEDTQIEPVVNNGSADQPLSLTCYGAPCDAGLEYEAYGELYLDILRDATSNTKNR